MVRVSFSELLKENQRRIGKALLVYVCGDLRAFKNILSQTRRKSLEKLKTIQSSPDPDPSLSALLYLDSAFSSLILKGKAEHLLRGAERYASQALRNSRTSRDPNEILAIVLLAQGRKDSAKKIAKRSFQKIIKTGQQLSRTSQEKTLTHAAFLQLIVGDIDGAAKTIRRTRMMSPTKNLIQTLIKAKRSGKKVRLENVSKRHLVDVINAIIEKWYFKWYWYLDGTFPSLSGKQLPILGHQNQEPPDDAYKTLLEKVEGHFVSSEEACMLERIFIEKFESKMRDLPRSFRTPWSYEKVTDWGRDGYVKIQESTSKKSFPRNGKSIFKITKKEFLGLGEERNLICEAVFWSHINSLESTGYDERPISLKEFLDLIETEKSLGYDRGRSFHVIGISSPTGWDKKIINYIVGKGFSKTYTLHNFVVILVDQVAGEIYYCEAHPLARWYSQLYKPEVDYETEAKARNWIIEFYDTAYERTPQYPHVLASEILATKGDLKAEFDLETCLRVLSRLESLGYGKLERGIDSETVFHYLKKPDDWK